MVTIEEILSKEFGFIRYGGFHGKGLNVECDEGWHDLIYELCSCISNLPYEDDFRVVQIKEKFGELRFYYDGRGSKEIDDLISEYEKKSTTVCEVCGEQGRVRDIYSNGKPRSWIRTLCAEHAH
jgi:hypothetical protein